MKIALISVIQLFKITLTTKNFFIFIRPISEEEKILFNTLKGFPLSFLKSAKQIYKTSTIIL